MSSIDKKSKSQTNRYLRAEKNIKPSVNKKKRKKSRYQTKTKPKHNKSTKNNKQYTRTELLKLSIQKLKIICNKNKYKTSKNATKLGLVNIILKHQKSKFIQLIDQKKITPSQRAEYLTS